MKKHMMSHVKVRSLRTYYILWTALGELPKELYDLKLSMGFNNNLPTYPPLVSDSSNLAFPTSC